MRSLIWISALLMSAACSEDGDSAANPTPDGSAGSGAVAGSGAGGSGGTAGNAGNGGSAPGTGGVPTTSCQMDAGIDECTACLGNKCCGDIQECASDATCSAAFKTYRDCAEAPGANTTACFGAFGVAMGGGGMGDGGGQTTPLALCILGQCQVCGAAALF